MKCDKHYRYIKSKFFCFLTISYSISGLDRVEPDPREDFRDALLNHQSNIDFSKLRELMADQKEDNAPSEYCCDKCGSRFQKEGNLRIHLVAKHKGADHILVKEGQNLTLEDKQKVRVCQFCEQPFGSNLALENHITKKHKTCSICKTTFSEPKDMEKCRAKHTTCEICNFDAKFQVEETNAKPCLDYLSFSPPLAPVIFPPMPFSLMCPAFAAQYLEANVFFSLH